LIAASFAFNNFPPVYFRFGIHRNPIIIVNAFNSSVSRRAVPNDALLIIGMTNAISGRTSIPRRDLASRSVPDVAAVSANAVDPPFA